MFSNALFYIFWGVTNALFYIFRAFPMPYFTCFEHFQCLKKGGTVSEPYHASYYTVLKIKLFAWYGSDTVPPIGCFNLF